MKSRNLIEREKCETMHKLGMLERTKEKSYWNGVIIKEVFTRYGLNFTAQNIVDTINELMPEDVFYTKRENKINLELLVKKLLRFKSYMKSYRMNSNTVVKGAGATNVVNNITVDYSLIVINDDDVRIYKVKNKKNSELKVSGRTIFTRISDSMELYLLQLAGEKLYPNKNVTPGIVFLSHKDDKGATLVDDNKFNEKVNTNIVETYFTDENRKNLDKRIFDIINNNVNSCHKTCSTCMYNDICEYVDNNINLKVIPVKAKTFGKVQFTKNQQKVIDSDSGVFRVLAGAGSGKTTCIANRIVKLIQNGTNLNEILLITYTTKGVEEMYEKIEYWLKMNNIAADMKDFNIYTFNGFGQDLIRKEYKNYGFTSEPVLLEKAENLDLIKTILDNHDEVSRYNYVNPFMNLAYAKGAVYQVFDDFELLKKLGVVYTEEAAEALKVSNEEADEILKLYREYKTYMKDHNCIDYNDQIDYCFNILCNDDNLKKYGFEHVICDEFQDSANVQINILYRLSQCKYNKSIMVVGDDSQAIYSWRGATSDNIINFRKFFPSAVDIELVENFRSSCEICEFANGINDINKNKVDKQLVGVFHGTDPVIKHGKISDLVELTMADIQKNNIPYSDVAIIARNKKLLLEARQILLSKNVPAILSVSELLVDNQAVRHIANFFKFLSDESLDLYFAEYLQVLNNEEFVKQKESNLFYKYIDDEKIKFLNNYSKCTTDAEQIAFVFDKLEKIAQNNNAISSLVNVLKEKNLGSISEMEVFLNNIILYKSDNIVEATDEKVDAITLTTAHSSKGKEWKHVYLDLTGFKYPTNYEQDKNNPLVEEERRLVFVAVTRAKEYLTLIGRGGSSIIKEMVEVLHRNK